MSDEQRPTLEQIANTLAFQYVDDTLLKEGEAAILAELIQAEACGFQRCLDLHLTAQVSRVADLLAEFGKRFEPVSTSEKP